jgi:type II secretory ATPase GspE/PulE/Tfp pilus assembly ATPase PilB-like protein
MEDLRSLGVSQPEQIRALSSRPPPPMPNKSLDDSVDETTARIVIDPSMAGGNDEPVAYHPGGCEECSGTGYRGRVGIFELLVIDEPVRREVLNSGDSNAIMRVATSRGMRTLREDGARQVFRGHTSIEEVLAATQAGEVE